MLQILSESASTAASALVVLEAAKEAFQIFVGASDESRLAAGQPDLVAPEVGTVAGQVLEDDVIDLTVELLKQTKVASSAPTLSTPELNPI